MLYRRHRTTASGAQEIRYNEGFSNWTLENSAMNPLIQLQSLTFVQLSLFSWGKDGKTVQKQKSRD